MQGDTKLFRKSFIEAGFRPHPGFPSIVFNDRHKSGETRKLKLWHGDGVFNAPQFAQEALEERFKANFGERYLGGQFIAAHPRIANKSFVIYLLEV
jgi:hypothetical protein